MLSYKFKTQIRKYFNNISYKYTYNNDHWKNKNKKTNIYNNKQYQTILNTNKIHQFSIHIAIYTLFQLHFHFSIMQFFLFSKFPRLSTKWTFLFSILLTLKPFHDTLHVESMTTGSPKWRTVITGILHVRWTCFICHATYTTYLYK